MDTVLPQAASTRPPPTVRQVAAVVAGNGLEFYDFLTFSFFAVQIGQTFFPFKDNPTLSLLASLATFGAGFLTRPIGAVFIGRLADRAGRRPAMLLSFALMGVAITGLALTPGYRTIGIAAPILAVVFRLLQGFALGGEVGPSTAYLLEAAPPHRRGFYASLQYMGQDTAVLCAGLMGFLLSSLMSPDGLRDYGWRIALLVGTLIVPFALLLRRGLAETLVPAAPAGEGTAVKTPIPWRIVLLGFAMLAAGTTANYVLDYMTTYASTTLHMATRLAFGATVAVGLAGLTCDMLGGLLSDRFGRRPVMLIPWIGLLLAVGPCFWLIAHFRNLAALMAATALMSGLLNVATSAMLTSVTESLPMRVRSGTLALVYALAISVFGGSAQFNVAALTHLLHSELVPAFYMGGGVLIGLVAMLAMRESAPVRLAPALATSAAAP